MKRRRIVPRCKVLREQRAKHSSYWRARNTDWIERLLHRLTLALELG